MTPVSKSPFETLREKLGHSFEAIRLARLESEKKLEELGRLVNGLTPPDTAFVLFGSLARMEWTSGSDLDWTLLVDGPVDLHHQQAAKEFANRTKRASYKDPGPTGVFGNLSFSHDLIHRIGGERDTNTNMTRRLLLVLESASLSRVDAHSRIVSMVLKRYLESERSFLAETGRKYRVPRFLLNDVVRYWRTMAVDYVNKQWERGDEGWALRNIKLRFSRKLIFVSGLLLCFSAYLEKDLETEDVFFRDQDEAVQKVHRHLVGKIGSPPIDVVCHHLLTHGGEASANKILSAYDLFLDRLNEPEVRERLKSLRPEDAYSDPSFEELREQSHLFQEGLTSMFYEDNEAVRESMMKYGVF